MVHASVCLSAAFTKVSHPNGSALITTTGFPIGYTDRLMTERSLSPVHYVTTTVKMKQETAELEDFHEMIEGFKHTNVTKQQQKHSYNTSHSLLMYKKCHLVGKNSSFIKCEISILSMECLLKL